MGGAGGDLPAQELKLPSADDEDEDRLGGGLQGLDRVYGLGGTCFGVRVFGLGVEVLTETMCCGIKGVLGFVARGLGFWGGCPVRCGRLS